MVHDPMVADVRAIVQRAAFPVVFPDGVPAGLRVFGIAYSPVERPTLVTIQYGNAKDPWAMGISLIDTDAISAGQKLLPPAAPRGLTTQGYHFGIGRETVLVQGRNVSRDQAARIRTAMIRESPALTANAFDKLLPGIVVLQKVTPQAAQFAERIARPGRNVLIGQWDLRALSRLAEKGKPLRDSRTVFLTNIPQVHGAPDYRNATLFWPKIIALSSAGVRAVLAAMRRTHTRPNCNCAILVHDADGIYTIWRIDPQKPTATQL